MEILFEKKRLYRFFFVPLPSDKKQSSMIKRIMITVMVAIVLVSCQESLEERAAREAKEMTESKCPMPVDNNTILDSVVFDIPTLTQTQYFRFIGESDDSSRLEEISGAYDLKELLIRELKGQTGYKTLMNRGVNFRYVYRSTRQRDKIYFDFTLTKEDYQ